METLSQSSPFENIEVNTLLSGEQVIDQLEAAGIADREELLRKVPQLRYDNVDGFYIELEKFIPGMEGATVWLIDRDNFRHPIADIYYDPKRIKMPIHFIAYYKEGEPDGFSPDNPISYDPSGVFPNRYYRCSSCDFTAKCTERNDFYLIENDPKYSICCSGCMSMIAAAKANPPTEEADLN